MFSLALGDLVVHPEHGIGRFDGIETVTVDETAHDCLRLVYEEEAKLLVPVEEADQLCRYGAADSHGLDRLPGTAWQQRRDKAREQLDDVAAELIRIAAERRAKRGTRVRVPDEKADAFAAGFPHALTEDQEAAVEAVTDDLASGRPMDRLVCGDVGFGKTEVALRAAFAVAQSGLQVAVIAPTTLLARQHFEGFSARFEGFGIKVAALSRLIKGKAATEVKAGIADGSVGIAVGTHALLAEDVRFHKLGLVIVDEEQRFGVKQKERMKALRTGVHALTMTATPIPRTLQMAMAGIRDLSLIASPPAERLAIRTHVQPDDPSAVREALMREKSRKGQSFYVCPRIEDLEPLEQRLGEIVPGLKVIVAHGRMKPAELEQRMLDFVAGKADVLLTTSIIETGIDVPRANTMVVHRADLFGLAQLYQIRGRIGRSTRRAHAYLMHDPEKPLSPDAQQRLDVLATLDTLGAGFALASHDLEIRGGGNVMGEEQSGSVKAVGIEMYQRLLEEAVRASRGGAARGSAWTPAVQLGVPVLIPESYIPDTGLRLHLYRRIAELGSADDAEGFAEEMAQRFGPLPPEVENLLALVEIRRRCLALHIESVDAGPRGIVLGFRGDAARARCATVLGEEAKQREDGRLALAREWEGAPERVGGVLKLLVFLADEGADPPSDLPADDPAVLPASALAAAARSAARASV